jgi:hypothetical protein
MDVDLYELMYRNYTLSENSKVDSHFVISEDTTKSVTNVLKRFIDTKPIPSDKTMFSKVICNTMPVFDAETNNFSCIYEYIFAYENKDENPIEYAEKFKKFNIDSLPLINVAKFIGIKVEKSNSLDVYGKFEYNGNKIILGSDSAQTFIHELAHAIDHILGNDTENYDENELVAEFSSVVLCKTYNIPINESHSMDYLNSYCSGEGIDRGYFIKRVSSICEYIKKCIEKMKNNGT